MSTEKSISMQLVCFSHLSWKFVYQRPQHLMTRFTKKYCVYYIEEFADHPERDGYSIITTKENVKVIVPYLQKECTSKITVAERKEKVLKIIFSANSKASYIFWYYTPMALAYTSSFNPLVTVYDCMDELSAFKFAPPALKTFEQDLFQKADIVFTGGNNLYKAKKASHKNIFSFPSSIDKAHFRSARETNDAFADQDNIPHPRLGFYGVIDERFDIELIKQAADAKPDWHFVLIGPVIKIDPDTLPKNSNIHYLGAKTYDDLPTYLAGWDIALIPFAINRSTQYISPTKTPEYLAAGKPVISTPIIDVMNPYYELGLVHIVATASDLIDVATGELNIVDKQEWLANVDEYLKGISWDATWERMDELVQLEVDENTVLLTEKINEYVRLFNSRSRVSRVGASRTVGIKSQ